MLKCFGYRLTKFNNKATILSKAFDPTLLTHGTWLPSTKQDCMYYTIPFIGNHYASASSLGYLTLYKKKTYEIRGYFDAQKNNDKTKGFLNWY